MHTNLALVDTAEWIGAVASIIAVILSVIVYLLTRKKKALSYEVLSEYSLISIADEIKGNLQVLYGGNPVENVHLLLVKFLNSGNVPITTSDFERPITLQLRGESKVLSAERVKASPDNLRVSLKVEDKVVTVEPALMNGGDFFTTKVLIGQYSGSFDIDARIVGVKSIRVLRRQTDRALRDWKLPSIRTFAAILILVTFALFLIFIANNNSGTPQDDSPTPSPTPESTPYEIVNSNTTRIVIPTFGAATPYPAEIAISGTMGSIQKLTVEVLDLSHACMSDVGVLLAGPNGQGVILMADVGSCDPVNHANLIFDDDAQASMSSVASGRYRPSGKANMKFPRVSLTQVKTTLSSFNGQSPNGTWGIYVFDDAANDRGRFEGGWKLTMTVDPRVAPQQSQPPSKATASIQPPKPSTSIR